MRNNRLIWGCLCHSSERISQHGDTKWERRRFAGGIYCLTWPTNETEVRPRLVRRMSLGSGICIDNVCLFVCTVENANGGRYEWWHWFTYVLFNYEPLLYINTFACRCRIMLQWGNHDRKKVQYIWMISVGSHFTFINTLCERHFVCALLFWYALAYSAFVYSCGPV